MSENKLNIAFIINPISGTSSKDFICKEIEHTLDTTRFNYEIHYTEYAGHASVLTKELSDKGVDVVVAVGGDGTVNEVARSLVHRETALGIIPCGSGNGLARHLQLPMDPRKCLQVINECYIKAFDYGIINDMPFFCTCGVGFDAFISLKFSSSGKRGILSYLENTLKEYLKYEPVTYDIEVDDNPMRYKAFLIACANASQYGNNAYIAPHASMSDGIMDVTIIEPFTMFDAPQIALQLFNRTIDKNPHIKTLRCKHLKIHRPESGVIHYDGDPIMTGDTIDVRIVSKGLKAIYNHNSNDVHNTILQDFVGYIPGLEAVKHEITKSNQRIMSLNKEILRKLTNNKNEEKEE